MEVTNYLLTGMILQVRIHGTVCIFTYPQESIIIFSDDEQGMFHHLRNAYSLGSMKPSQEVSQDP